MAKHTKQRILLLRLDAIGDFVLFTSVLPHLRKLYASDDITLVVHPAVAPLAEHCPYVDRVLPIDPLQYALDAGYISEVTVMVQDKFDIAINAMYTRTWQSDNIIARSRAPVKVGFECIDKDGQEDRRRSEQVLFTHLIRASTEWAFEIDHYQQFLEVFGVHVNGDALRPELWLQEDEREWAERFLRNRGTSERRYVILCPGAGFDSKLWSNSSFAKVADQIVEQYDLNLWIVGSVSEQNLAKDIIGAMKREAQDLTGKLTLRQFAAIAERSRLYVGIDTAGFHISWSLGIPTIGIFGGGHYGRFTPSMPHVRIVHYPMDCYYCYWHCIYDEVKCITSITPEMVLAQIKGLMNQKENVVAH